MMAAQKHLHELLREDQEPFLLKSYITDRRSQLLKPPSPRRAVAAHSSFVKRRLLSQKDSNFGRTLCRNPCFYPFNHGFDPHPTKSPLFDHLQSRPKTAHHPVFLHVPAETAALLLEAALRIHNNKDNNGNPSSSSSSPTEKPKGKSSGIGILMGSLLKRLKKRNRTARNMQRERCSRGPDHDDERRPSVKDILRCDDQHSPNAAFGDRRRRSFRRKEESETNVDYHSKGCCSNSLHFSAKEGAELPNSPSSVPRTPGFRSPAASPNHRESEGNESCEEKSLKKFLVNQPDGEVEEEKEQSSPVSILDRPFEDEDEDNEDNGHCSNVEGDQYIVDKDDDDGYVFDYDNSYALVQRTKQQLLQKLYRFERLAELDPVELEKRMLEQASDDEDREDIITDVKTHYFEELEGTADIELNSHRFARQAPTRACCFCPLRRLRMPCNMMELVPDFITEEELQRKMRFAEKWQKVVDLSAIEMMVDQDLREEVDGWRKVGKDHHLVDEDSAVQEIEVAIFGSLLQEVTEELLT